MPAKAFGAQALATYGRRSSLTCHGDAEALLGADEVVGILGGLGDVDLHPLHLAVERAGTRRIVVADRRTGVLAQVGSTFMRVAGQSWQKGWWITISSNASLASGSVWPLMLAMR